MSRRLRRGLALAAGWLLAASCAAEGRTHDEAIVYSPVPVSTLVSRRDLPFKVGQVQRGACRVTVLAYQAPGADPSPVALMASFRAGDDAQVSVHRLSRADEGKASDLDVATAEHLYALAMRQEPEATFRLTDSTDVCQGAKDGHSHAEFLRLLAQARQRAVAEAARSVGSVPWQVVSMAPAVSGRADGDDVGVKVTSDQGPMQGATIIFNRAPHSGCVAKTRGDGIATCRLVDQHGDGDSHGEDGKAPVVATFPGDVRDGRVLVPTTFLMPPTP